MVSDIYGLMRALGATVVIFIAGHASAAPLDFDGDGISDLFGFENQRDGSANELAYRILRSSDQTVSKIEFGNANDAPVPADYDGDGITDLGFVRLEGDGTLVWNMRLSSEDNEVSTSTFGAANDQVVSGCDFDGDMKADQAVLRGSDLIILKSGDSTETTIALGLTPEHITCGERDGVVGDELIVNHLVNNRSTFSSFNLAGEVVSAVAYGSKVIKILALDADGDGMDEIGYLMQGGTRIYVKVGESNIAIKVKKTLSVATGRYAADSAIDGIAGKIEKNDSFSQIPIFGAAAFPLVIGDTTTLLPPVRLQSVGPRQSREGVCTAHFEPFDGPNGFLYKPVSDSNRKPAVLLPAGIRGGKVRFLKNGKVLETLRYGGNGNGKRDHFRSNKAASSFPFEMTVAQTRGSTTRCWLLDDPTVRHD